MEEEKTLSPESLGAEKNTISAADGEKPAEPVPATAEDGELAPAAEKEEQSEEKATVSEEKATASEEKATESEEKPEAAEKPKRGFKAWWDKHGLSRRRLIQIYAALLYNANIKGYIKGDIFTGISKTACVPGLNCYSCPGAIGACPLGALQNALAGTKARAPFFMLGIIMLYGLILGRTICGWLCPVGLAQDLLYKIKTPKIKKSKVTRILSYLKYVILLVLVVAIPLIYAGGGVAVPGFCKYVCPAGTFGGAILLLINPKNTAMFELLGSLFTWKAIVLFVVAALCIFCYRAFCRFLCPMGAIYGLFNKISLLGIKVNKSACIDCGKCVDKCKMDIKKVGDHECINCGECAPVCPTNAIVWKGGKVFLRNVDKKEVPVAEPTEITEKAAEASAGVPEKNTPSSGAPEKGRKKLGKGFWLRVVSVGLAVVLFAGAVVYSNFFENGTEAETLATYDLEVGYGNRKTGILVFSVGNSKKYVSTSSGDGTSGSPYIIGSAAGIYEVPIDEPEQKVYFRFGISKKTSYKITTDEPMLSLKLSYYIAGKRYAAYDYALDGDEMKLDVEMPSGYGNSVGDKCFDFTLQKSDGTGSVALSDLSGKIVIINFWGTWCGPCVKELPHFERVRADHSDDVEVLAIHSAEPKDDVWAYITDKSRRWDEWGVIFLQDTGTEKKSDIYTLLGGRNGAYPRTVIVDRDGTVAYVTPKSVSYESLSAVISSIIGQ